MADDFHRRPKPLWWYSLLHEKIGDLKVPLGIGPERWKGPAQDDDGGAETRDCHKGLQGCGQEAHRSGQSEEARKSGDTMNGTIEREIRSLAGE